MASQASWASVLVVEVIHNSCSLIYALHINKCTVSGDLEENGVSCSTKGLAPGLEQYWLYVNLNKKNTGSCT